MKLDTLEIHGFKSFADRTIVEFNPGVTAIVGPNGCGKTNITDAIRWVLGEQRPTALRGASMQEVIFNGTRDRKPLGMAEVTLSFTNALGLIPVEFSEVSITRRVFRNEESQYFLNKSLCNLKDIRDLFMGTGVGSSVYSVIEQRMVDAILSDRAEERRVLFEEAAGVTRYKARRKATERKLGATEEDLRRLSDILTEVRKNTNALRRQMGKARRFEALQRQELRLAVALAQTELADLAARETPLREAIAVLEADLRSGAADAALREAELERLDAALGERRAEERTLRERVAAATADLEARERERVLAGEGRRHAVLEVERLAGEIAAHREQAGGLIAKRDGMAEGLAASQGEATAARREAESRAAVVDDLTRRFEAAQAALREARAARERCVEERMRVEAELARATAERQAAAARSAELEAGLAALGGVAGEDSIVNAREKALAGGGVGASRGSAASEASASSPAPPGRLEGAGVPAATEEPAPAEHVERLRTARLEQEEALADAADRRLAAAGAVAALEAELAELDARRREITARLDTLEELEDGFAGYGEGARRALEARHAIAPGLSGPLGLEVEVAEARYALAVEAYLDSFLDALLTSENHEARAVLEFWRERNQTGAVWPLSDAAPTEHPDLEPAARALVVCRGTEAAALRGELDRHRQALFGRLLLAENLERAIDLRRHLNGNGSAGWYVVAALTGEVLEPSGLVRLPHRKAEGEGVSRFHQAEHLKAVLDEVLREADELETRAGTARAAEAAAQAAERAAQVGLAECADALAAAERELERLHDARRAALGRAAELARELAAMGERHARETRTVAETSARAAEIQAVLDTAEADCSSREIRVESLRLEREGELRELGAAELAAEQRAAALAALRRERRYLDEAAEEQERLARADEGALSAQRERIGFLESEAVRLSAAAEEERAALSALRRTHGSLETEIRTLETERAAKDTAARASRREHEEGSRRLHVEEMRLADLLHRRQSIHAILETEFGQPLPELVRKAETRLTGDRAAASEDRKAETRLAGDRAAESEDRKAEGGVFAAEEAPAADALVLSPAPSDDPSPEERGAALESLRNELRGVREKKSALGPVNLLALEEFGTEKERLDFLETQYADLVKAREDLRQAIRTINATARELFLETFVRARENFQTTFGTLFEGGRADISLADESDPLESPIEIAASPRGKRIQAVNLLSGGERALTALSLLFAIYLVKPSPFCILDEVDAPLDDANIGRFLRMIRSFSDRTQFIVVTHNKRTMEASDFLYGVTMEEAGVSKLVSVDFERRNRFDYDAIDYRRGGLPVSELQANGAAVSGDDPPLEADGDETVESQGALVGD